MKKKLGLRKVSNVLSLVRVMYLRDVERGIRPEVGGGNSEALLNLVGSLGAVMLNVAVLGLDIVGVEVGNCGDIGVGDLAVVALIIVVGQNLPVKLALLIPGVVKDVILKVVVVKSGLLIDTVKVVLPGNLGVLASIQVDPDKTISVNMHMDRGEIVVEESIDASLLVLDYDEIVASDFILNPVTSVGNTVLMGSEKPFPGEDRSPFKLVHALGGVPGSGQSTDSRLLVLRRSSGGTKVIPQERHCEYKSQKHVFVIKKEKEV